MRINFVLLCGALFVLLGACKQLEPVELDFVSDRAFDLQREDGKRIFFRGQQKGTMLMSHQGRALILDFGSTRGRVLFKGARYNKKQGLLWSEPSRSGQLSSAGEPLGLVIQRSAHCERSQDCGRRLKEEGRARCVYNERVSEQRCQMVNGSLQCSTVWTERSRPGYQSYKLWEYYETVRYIAGVYGESDGEYMARLHAQRVEFSEERKSGVCGPYGW